MCRNVLSTLVLDWFQFNQLTSSAVGHRTCASFQASLYGYVLTSYCSDIAREHMNVETCSKLAQVSFLCVNSLYAWLKLIDFSIWCHINHSSLELLKHYKFCY